MGPDDAAAAIMNNIYAMANASTPVVTVRLGANVRDERPPRPLRHSQDSVRHLVHQPTPTHTTDETHHVHHLVNVPPLQPQGFPDIRINGETTASSFPSSTRELEQTICGACTCHAPPRPPQPPTLFPLPSRVGTFGTAWNLRAGRNAAVLVWLVYMPPPTIPPPSTHSLTDAYTGTKPDVCHKL